MHIVGILFIVIGGMMEGLFTLPLKLTPRWSWENTWLAGSLAALILVPWPLALTSVSNLGAVYSSAPTSAITLSALFGLGWGLGGVFFGLGVSRLGISLATSLIMGLIAISGSLVPLLIRNDRSFSNANYSALLVGIIIMIIGLGICTYAGNLKIENIGSVKGESSSSFGTGIFYCLAAGLLSALVNFALIFGGPITSRAVASGTASVNANNAVWAIVFTANYLFNIAYCIVVSVRNRTLSRLWTASRPHYWLLAVLMGTLWAGGIVVYGRGAALGGPLGPYYAFPMMLIVSILASNGAGAITGEWKGQPRIAKFAMTFGVTVMLSATLVLGYASYLTA